MKMFEYLATIEKYSGECAFRFLDEEKTFEVSYDQYLKDMRTCATRLENKLGNVQGKHVGLIGCNSYEYVVIMAALVFSRAVVVPLNYRETNQNLTFAIKNAKIDCLISDDLEKHNFGEDIKYLGFDVALSGEAEERDLKDFTEDEVNNLAMIIYTSGTTSLSKGVALSVGNLLYEKRYPLPEEYSNGFKTVPGVKIYTNFPFYHVGGMLVWLTWTEHGCTITQSVQPQNILSDLVGEKIDVAFVTPATIKLWLKTIRRGHIERLGGLKIALTGGAPISIDDVKELAANDIIFGQYYGMTETCGSVTFNCDMENYMSSVGKPCYNAKIKIIDGEICIKHWGNMLGYYDNEEETQKILRDGLIYTGDLGKIDEDGYLYITGRKKNLIILSSGENVSPEELEKLLYECNEVKECKAFEKDDRIAVAVYAEEKSQDTIREFVSNLNKVLPIYKRIYKIEFQTEELEKTASGKIKRIDTVALQQKEKKLGS